MPGEAAARHDPAVGPEAAPQDVDELGAEKDPPETRAPMAGAAAPRGTKYQPWPPYKPDE